MELELLTVGTELVLGLTVDTNAAEIARALAAIGIRVRRWATVSDEAAAIRGAAADALARTGFVVITGGLGPTKDDVTKTAIAELFGTPLELDAAYLARLEQRFAHLSRGPLPPSNRTQAEVPRGATVLPNPRGTAPGLWLEGPQGVAVMLPGVPHEMRGLVREELIPRLQALHWAAGPANTIQSLMVRTTGISESALASKLDGVEATLAPVTLAYLPGLDGVDLRLTAWDQPPEVAKDTLRRAADLLTPLIAPHGYGRDAVDLAAVVLDGLRRRSATLAVAESCTGGLLGARLTAIPGASDVFLGGVICYSDDVKVRGLDVPPDLLAAHGAVSEPVVRCLVAGAQRRFGSTAALAITGIAGPSGGSEDKPVGTVWLAARLGDAERALIRRYPGDRADVRVRSAQSALDLLRRMVESADG